MGLTKYAEELANGGLKASVVAIGSRLGPGITIEEVDADEGDADWDAMDNLIAEARLRVRDREDPAEEPEEETVEEPMEKAEIDLMADGMICKTDDDERVVFGWAYVTHDSAGNVNVDKSGDFIDQVEEIEKSAYDFVLNSRQSDSDHSNVKGGTLVESVVFTPDKIAKMGLPEGSVPLGWWVGFKIEDDKTWDRVKKKELTAFSVHGKGTRNKVAPTE
jgi:hypothetical protein